MTTTARNAALIFALSMLAVNGALSLREQGEARSHIDAVEAEIAAERAAEQEPARR